MKKIYLILLNLLLITLFISSCNNDKIVQINDDIKDLKVKYQELNLKFDKLLNKSPEYKEEIEQIKLFDKNDSQQVKTVKTFIQTSSLDEKLKLVLEPEKVKPILENKLKLMNRIPQIINITEPKKIKDNLFEVDVFTKDHSEKDSPDNYYLYKINDDYKIDWLSSIGYNKDSLNYIENDTNTNINRLKLIIYEKDYPSKPSVLELRPDEDYFSVAIKDENYTTAYIKKDTEHGKKLIELIKDGFHHNVTLDVRLIKGDIYNDFYIEDFIHEGWYE